MKAIKNRTRVITAATTAILGMALIGLASCSSGESTTGQVTTGGSAALQGPLVFVHNSTEQTTSVVALRGDTGNSVIKTMGKGFPIPGLPGHPNGAYNGNTPGDMQFSEGEWVFVNVGGIVPGPGALSETLGSRVALIDPLSGATPIFEDLLQIGERPVHIYRDPTDGEVIWSMIDGNGTTGVDNVPATFKVGALNVTRDCSLTGGGAVTILHNSHIGPGGNVPKIIEKVCLLAKGHKVTAFSSGTGVPKRAFVSSTTAGEISVIDNEQTLAGGGTNPNYLKLIDRIDLCEATKEANPATCDSEVATPLTTAFTPNNSSPHGIRFSKLTKKIYSIQENYRTLVEIDPNSLAITNTFDLSGTPYTGYGITPDGRYLLLRGIDITSSATRLTGMIGVYDLSTTPATRIDFPLPDLSRIVPGSFKMAPDGKKLYLLAANSAPTSGPIVPNANQVADMLKDRLFVYDLSVLPSTPPTPQIFSLLSTNGNHSLDIYADGPSGAGSARYIVVSNGSPANSVSIINATTNFVAQPVPVGNGAGTILVYYPDAALNNNQATASLTGGSKSKPSVLPERLDDHGMPD
jgi:hypothetical protein